MDPIRKAIITDVERDGLGLVIGGVVDNVIVLPHDWTGADGEWQAAEDAHVMDAGMSSAGWRVASDGGLVAPEPVAPPLTRREILARLTDAEVATLAALHMGTPAQQRWWLHWHEQQTYDPSNDADVAFLAETFGAERAAALLALAVEPDETEEIEEDETNG